MANPYQRYVTAALAHEWSMSQELGRELRFHATLAFASAALITFTVKWTDGRTTSALREIAKQPDLTAMSMKLAEHKMILVPLCFTLLAWLWQMHSLFCASTRRAEASLHLAPVIRNYWLGLFPNHRADLTSVTQFQRLNFERIFRAETYTQLDGVLVVNQQINRFVSAKLDLAYLGFYTVLWTTLFSVVTCTVENWRLLVAETTFLVLWSGYLVFLRGRNRRLATRWLEEARKDGARHTCNP